MTKRSITRRAFAWRLSATTLACAIVAAAALAADDVPVPDAGVGAAEGPVPQPSDPAARPESGQDEPGTTSAQHADVAAESAAPREPIASDSEEDAVARVDDQQSGVENITVTAQKREQALQEVPAAVSALSGQQLDQSGVTQLQDLAFQVPNMHWGQQQGQARITIRGVSNAQDTDQATAFHVDGIYQNRAQFLTSLTFFDVKRVEVLRGPQGTLYGRNATGGAINVISNQPRPEFELFGDVQFGNYDQILARGVLNVPVLEDLLALRVSGYMEKRDGYQINEHIDGPVDDADDADDFGLRGQILLSPSERLGITGRVNYFRKGGVGYGLKRQGPLPDSVALPVIGAQPIYAGATPNPEDPRHVVLDTKGSNDDESLGGNLDFTWRPSSDLIGDTKLRVLGSYVEYDESAFSDQDHSDVFIATLEQIEFNREYVAEVNWSSDGDSRIGWLLGAFFLGAEGTDALDAPSQLPINVLPQPVDVGFAQFFERESYSAAGFVNAWWQITDRLQLEAGFRYSYDWKRSIAMHPESEITVLGQTILLFPAIDDRRSGEWGRPSGSLTLDYEIDDGMMTYLRFATGYKSGFLNNDIAVLADPDPLVPPDADPEDIFSLEWGSKNLLLDNRLSANLTVFAYWYQDLQVSQLVQAQQFVENAASARSFGVEVELVYKPWNPLTLTAQFAYLNTEYTDYQPCVDGKDLTRLGLDCTGNTLSRAPPFSGTFIATYDIDLARYGTLTPFFQVYASDEVFFRPTNEPDDRQEPYAYLNFRLAWKSARGHLGLEAFVENALDEDVATTKIVGSQLLGAPLLNAYDRPRTFGGRVSLSW